MYFSAYEASHLLEGNASGGLAGVVHLWSAGSHHIICNAATEPCIVQEATLRRS